MDQLSIIAKALGCVVGPADSPCPDYRGYVGNYVVKSFDNDVVFAGDTLEDVSKFLALCIRRTQNQI